MVKPIIQITTGSQGRGEQEPLHLSDEIIVVIIRPTTVAAIAANIF